MSVLTRLLVLFTRLRKHNYVLVTSYVLAVIAWYRKQPSWSTFQALFPFLSSEPLEVYHSKARAVIRHYDKPAQAAQKVMYVSSSTSTTPEPPHPPSEKEREQAKMESMLGHWALNDGNSRKARSGVSEDERAAGRAIKSIFADLLLLGNEGVVVELLKMKPTSKSRLTLHYELVHYVQQQPKTKKRSNNAQTQATGNTTKKRKSRKTKNNTTNTTNTTDNQENESPNPTDAVQQDRKVLLTFPETLIPPTLWQDPVVKLRCNVDISSFQTIPQQERASKGDWLQILASCEEEKKKELWLFDH